MLMSQGAIDALEEQAFDDGFKKGQEETEYDWRLVAAQHKKLAEILEVEGDMNLMDAAEQLGVEVRAHREAAKAGANAIERRRLEVEELRAALMEKERENLGERLFFDKERAAMNLYIRELQDAVEPQQKKICELNVKIIELRQSLLMHVKETSINE